MSLQINYEKFLSVENWQEIFGYVSLKDLCSVMRTSNYMKSLASRPDLWSEMKVNMQMVREKGLSQLYDINRFKKIISMDMDLSRSRVDFTSEEIERVLIDIPGSPLKNINLTNQNLSLVPAQLLANAVSHLESAVLTYTQLTSDQCNEVLETSLSSTTLVNMNLEGCILSQVPAQLLVDSICRLLTVDLRCTRLTNEQCIKLLQTSLSSKTLVNMNLRGCNLSQVPAQLLADSICRLQSVALGGTCLTCEQWIKLLETNLSSKTLVNMNLSGCNLSQVPAQLLADSVCRLQTVDLAATRLTSEQWIKLLETNLSSKTLVNINLTRCNLSQVPTQLLADSVCRLKTVDLTATRLTSEHWIKLLETSLYSKTVSLKVVNIHGVPADLLAKAKDKY